jgi:hypothetical protein
LGECQSVGVKGDEQGQAGLQRPRRCRPLPSSDDEQRLTELDWLAVLDQDLLDHAGSIGIDLIQQLHCLDDAQGVAFLDIGADVDEWR